MSHVIRDRFERASRVLGAVNPAPFIGRALEEAFDLPQGDPRYGRNALTPGAAPLEPSFSEAEPYGLRFTMEPLGPHGSPAMKRQEASRQVRAMVGPVFGPDALYWFDRVSEGHRGVSGGAGLRFGAWWGGSFDRDGMYNSKVYYELTDPTLADLPQPLAGYVATMHEVYSGLHPLFLSLSVRNRSGMQRVTFQHSGPLKVEALQPLLAALGLDDKLPALSRIFGLALGGAFEAPEGSVLIGIAHTPEGPELTVDLLLAAIANLPDSFIELLRLGMAERPRHLRALNTFMTAFTPDGSDLPGEFSVLSVKMRPGRAARVDLSLRPLGFEAAPVTAQ